MTFSAFLLVVCSVAAARVGSAITEETMMSNPAALLNRPEVRSTAAAVPEDLGSWKPWEAHAEAIGPYRREVAQAVGVSASLIERQCRSDVGRGTGKRTDGKRIVMKVEALRELGVAENQAMLEVWWIVDACGYSRPRPKGGLTVPDESPLAMIGRVITESADVVREGNLAYADDALDLLEIERLDRETREAVVALEDLRALLCVHRARLLEACAA